MVGAFSWLAHLAVTGELALPASYFLLEELNNSLDSFDWALNSYNEYIADMEAEYRSDMMAENDYY